MCSEDVETQRKGAVLVLYALNQQQKVRGSKVSKGIRKIAESASALPTAIVGVHWCYENLAWMPALSVAQISCNLFLQLRFRAHFGM